LHKMRFSAHKMGGKQLGLTSKNASAGIATGDYAGFTGNSRCPIGAHPVLSKLIAVLSTVYRKRSINPRLAG
ncbi:hypothetical protein, partial [Massilia mucilaginosa]|uniref:hypothetical protein n=1 Tax=Massilia mucilaginosa TaxID=2609282 RepID=UPI001CB74117